MDVVIIIPLCPEHKDLRFNEYQYIGRAHSTIPGSMFYSLCKVVDCRKAAHFELITRLSLSEVQGDTEKQLKRHEVRSAQAG